MNNLPEWLQKQFDAIKPFAELAHQFERIKQDMMVVKFNTQLLPDISKLQALARLTPDLIPPEAVQTINEMYKEMYKEAYIVGNGPLQQILRSSAATQEFRDRLQSLSPRYILAIGNSSPSEDVETEVPELVIRDTTAPVGERDTSLEVLPGIVSMKDVLQEISDEDSFNLYNHLSEYPLLGLEHPVGQRIFEAVQNLECQETSGLDMYRGRDRSPGERPYTELDMLSPPMGKAVQGRANPQGLSYLYTCDSLECAVAEVGAEAGKEVDVVQWHLVEPVRMLDLSEVKAPLIAYCQFKSEKSVFNPSYLIPNFLSQCCAFWGIQAMRYPSVICPGARCFVFFRYARQWFKLVNFYRSIPIREPA